MINKLPVIAIYDVGKTNKKLFLFNEAYEIVWEESTPFTEVQDEDGFACENVAALTTWIKTSFASICANEKYHIKAVNFSAYGASFVHLGADLQPILPLYNYLKPYPPQLLQQFYKTYGGESAMARETASPVLANLNSGMQLYWLKHNKPAAFKQIKYSLHLPQYLSFILSGKTTTDITSIGCHTGLWNFQQNAYHHWVTEEGIEEKFAPITSAAAVAKIESTNVVAGSGLHDSSSALIPYLATFKTPFLLVSTGTWCISLNPFNNTVLTNNELLNDCLSFLTYEGIPVKASRLFAGYEHELQTKRLATYFTKPEDYYKTVLYNDTYNLLGFQDSNTNAAASDSAMVKQSAFANRNLADFISYEEAYHQLMADIMVQQKRAINYVLKNAPVKQLFVDGGFSKNPIYMHLLATAFPGIKVSAASVAQASATGAALAIHKHWNKKPLPTNIIQLKPYKAPKHVSP